MMASGNRDRSRRRRLGLSPPTGVPGVAGPGRAASPILLPRNGHLLHRGLWFGCCPHVWRCRSESAGSPAGHLDPTVPWWRRACPEGVEVRGQAPPVSASDLAHPANVSARSRSIRRAPSSGNDWGAVANRYQTEGPPKASSLTGRSLHCNAHVKVGVPREEEELM